MTIVDYQWLLLIIDYYCWWLLLNINDYSPRVLFYSNVFNMFHIISFFNAFDSFTFLSLSLKVPSNMEGTSEKLLPVISERSKVIPKVSGVHYSRER